MTNHGDSSASAQGPLRLYVGNLHVNVTEDELRKIFESYGELDFVSIQKEVDTARSKGYGFIQFRKTEDGKRAMAQVNGHELMGKQLRLNVVTETGKSSSSSDMSGPIMPLNDLDDEGGGMALNAKSRVLLMAKLQRDEVIVPDPLALLPAPAVNSPCILLKNMFDPATYASYNHVISSLMPCTIAKRILISIKRYATMWKRNALSLDQCYIYTSIRTVKDMSMLNSNNLKLRNTPLKH